MHAPYIGLFGEARNKVYQNVNTSIGPSYLLVTTAYSTYVLVLLYNGSEYVIVCTYKVKGGKFRTPGFSFIKLCKLLLGKIVKYTYFCITAKKLTNGTNFISQ